MELNPLDILPEELWEEITARMDPTSLWNLLHCTKLFSTLLKDKRCSFLFPQVFDVLLKKKYFGSRDIVTIHKMRLVCRNWRDGIHDAFASLPVTNKFSVIRSYEMCTRPRINRWVESFPFGFQFLTSLRLSASNLKFIKNVILPEVVNPNFKKDGSIAKQFVKIEHKNLTEDIPRAEFQDTVQQVLEVLGDSVTHAFLYVSFFEEEELYTFMCKILGLMPRLKVLRLVVDLFASESPHQLESAMEQYTMPRLASLEHVTITKMSSSMTNALLNAFTFTQTMEVIDISSLHAFLGPRRPDSLLGVSEIRPQHFHLTLNSIEELVNLNVTWPLASLQLEVLFVLKNEWLEDIFTNLEAFSPTLKSLSLLIRPVDRWFSIKASTRLLRLDNLTFLKFRNCGNCYIEFVRGLQSLKHLKLENKWKTGPTLNLRSSKVKHALNSNIWNELPALKRLDIRTDANYGFRVFKRVNVSSS